MNHMPPTTGWWYVRRLGKEGDKSKVMSEAAPPARRLETVTGSVLPAVSAVLVTLFVSLAAHAADPFYMRLLRQGTDAYNRRDYQPAVRQLRVACFGLLDEPQLLADGLTRLALAQAAAGDEAEFRETFQRLSEVEERFQGYSRADIPKDVRGAFELLVVQGIPRATLAENAAFGRLVPSRQDNVSKLPPAQRRKELERLIKKEPRDVSWRLMLADLELADGNASSAYAAADAALKLAPSNREALKLRGLAATADKRWSPAVEDLRTSGLANSDPKVAGALLSCLVELKRWQEANDFAVQLPSNVAKDRTVQQLTVSAAAGLTASRPAVAPTPTRAVPGGAKVGEKPAAGAGAVTGVVAGGPAQTSTPKPTAKPTASTGALGFPLGGSPRASTPKPTEKPTTGVGAGAGSPSAPAQKPFTRKGVLSTAERADLDRVQELAKSGMLDDAFAIARKVADARPDVVEPQFVAAEMAYRTTRWNDAVVYFRRAGDPGDGQPLLLFYSAVALYETGDRAGAATALKRCLPNIRRTSFVDDVARKVLGDSASVSQKP
jgi:tetratricopeptide (TPR) repeat protein